MIQFNLRYQLSFPIRFFGNEPVKLLIPVVALQSLMNKNIKHVNQMALLKNEMSQIHTYSCAYLCDSLQSHVTCLFFTKYMVLTSFLQVKYMGFSVRTACDFSDPIPEICKAGRKNSAFIHTYTSITVHIL